MTDKPPTPRLSPEDCGGLSDLTPERGEELSQLTESMTEAEQRFIDAVECDKPGQRIIFLGDRGERILLAGRELVRAALAARDTEWKAEAEAEATICCVEQKQRLLERIERLEQDKAWVQQQWDEAVAENERLERQVKVALEQRKCECAYCTDGTRHWNGCFCKEPIGRTTKEPCRPCRERAAIEEAGR